MCTWYIYIQYWIGKSHTYITRICLAIQYTPSFTYMKLPFKSKTDKTLDKESCEHFYGLYREQFFFFRCRLK